MDGLTDLMQMAGVALMGVATAILVKSQAILHDVTQTLMKFEATVAEFRDEVRDLRAEVRELREHNETNDTLLAVGGFSPLSLPDKADPAASHTLEPRKERAPRVKTTRTPNRILPE